jgi:hypothetical protein
MRLLHGWYYALVFNLLLCWYHSKPHTQHLFEKSWLMPWKPLVQLEGVICASLINPGSELLHRFLAASHQFYAQFYTKNGHHVVPIHDATAL